MNGLALAEAGELERAILELQKAVKVDNSDADAYYALGMLLERTGKDTEALEALLHSVRLNPAHASALFGLALLYEELDRPDDAVAAWKKFSAVSNDRELLELAQKHIRFLGER